MGHYLKDIIIQLWLIFIVSLLIVYAINYTGYVLHISLL